MNYLLLLFLVYMQTQEAPTPLIVIAAAVYAGLDSFLQNPTSARTLLVVVFLTHYSYRAFIFPFLLRGGKPTPVSVWAMSFVFCIHNGFLQVSIAIHQQQLNSDLCTAHAQHHVCSVTEAHCANSNAGPAH